MAEGVDSAASAFQRAIDPAQTESESSPRARESSGRFAPVAERPESLFQVRMIEGDPETGDTSDGGDHPRLLQREREVADGRVSERQDREAEPQSRQAASETEREGGERRLQRDDGAERGDAAADDGHAGVQAEQGDVQADAAVDEEADENQQYEITVDGEPQTVSLGELRDGYIRTATFHSRLNKVNEHKQAIDLEQQRVGQMRDLYIQGLQALDEDIRALSPTEPNWDEEYAKDALAARAKQKSFQAIYAKLNEIRSRRAWAIQNGKEEHDRASAKYAVEQFTEFVGEHPKLFKDEPTLNRIISGMRKTAMDAGFTEPEVAGVYDKRMLKVLLKAWLYDQGMAVKPQPAQAVITNGQGRSLAPGSARPLNGSAGRRNVDEAQRRLAATGRLEDAETVFQRLIR